MENSLGVPEVDSQNLLTASGSNYVAARVTVLGLCQLIFLCVSLVMQPPHQRLDFFCKVWKEQTAMGL